MQLPFPSLHGWILPLLAACSLSAAIYHVANAEKDGPPRPPLNAPAVSPYSNTLAGSGIAEPKTENIEIGISVPGVVTHVDVTVGQSVKKGDLLFRIDDREARAELEYRQAVLLSAKAELVRLKSLPRPEDIPVSQSRVSEAEAKVVDEADKFARAKQLRSKGVSTEEDFVSRQQSLQTAKHQLTRAEAEHALLLAGTWEPALAVQAGLVRQAEAQIHQTQTQLERLEIRAPVDGEILQVHVRPGQFVGQTSSESLMLLGDLKQLHVRVDIDENDIPRFNREAAATASLRGNAQNKFPLRFVRVEPYVIPKRSLTGDNTERVDTRVLQVIYAFEEGDFKIFVGQQLDVFIESATVKTPDHTPASNQPAVEPTQPTANAPTDAAVNTPANTTVGAGGSASGS